MFVEQGHEKGMKTNGPNGGNAVGFIERSDANRTNILQNKPINTEVQPIKKSGSMIRDPLFVEQTRWTTQNAMNMTTTRTEKKVYMLTVDVHQSTGRLKRSNRLCADSIEQ